MSSISSLPASEQTLIHEIARLNEKLRIAYRGLEDIAYETETLDQAHRLARTTINTLYRHPQESLS